MKALLDKLRIEAEVLVFWLASGRYAAYEAIINGKIDKPDTEIYVNDCLRGEEWWKSLQDLRSSSSMTSSQEFNTFSSVVEALSTRPNTQYGSVEVRDRRRASLSRLADLPKKPTVSRLVRLGVNMGIHTQNLPTNVFDSSDTEVDGRSDDGNSSSEESIVGDFNDAGSVVSDGDIEAVEPSRFPLLGALHRRKSYSDVMDRPKSHSRGRAPKQSQSPSPCSYGTLTPNKQSSDGPAGKENNGSAASHGAQTDQKPPERPILSRQSSSAMKFSSMLVPETRITNDAGGPRIMFADEDVRGGHSAHSRSHSRNPSRNPSVAPSPITPAADYKAMADEAGLGKRVSFAEPSADVQPSCRSRKTSVSKRNESSDSLVDIPESASTYSLGPEDEDDDAGSGYNTQGMPLSFNDLPSRAQHLILNEVMRQSSKDTAVLFTTLPIPEENTCKSEEASLAYLSSIEVLCNELPPVLLVLSNNMTVTVSL